MKIIRSTLTLILFCLSFMVSSQQFKSPVEYLDFVSEEQELISKNMWKYTKAIAHSKSDKNVNKKRQVLIKTMERAILKIKRAEGFDGDTYKEQVLSHLKFNKDLLNEEYAKIIDMKAVAEQSYDAMEAYMLTRQLADEKMAESQENYEKNFYAFANNHKIEIIESESDLGKKMKISNEVFDHYNAMYLIFFKVYINEVYLWDAMERKDVSAIQQNSNALNDAAKEGQQILKDVVAYKGDGSILEATQKAFEFFIDESENKVPTMVEFFLLNEEIESISATIEKTPERKRTKEQIDNYNKKVKDFNKAVKAYNKTNTELNTERQKALNTLNAANDSFLSRHIPKE